MVKLKDVKPEYSQHLHDAGIHGSVTLEGQINTDGTLINLEAVPPANPELVQAALEAVRQWRYTPTRLHGVATVTDMTITINFRQDGSIASRFDLARGSHVQPKDHVRVQP
jgi:periplasmic protein TonB